MRKALAFLLALICLFSSATAGAVSKGFTVFNGDRNIQSVSLTVDDCYEIEYVEQILDLCEQYGIQITFFVLGCALEEKDRAVWQRAIDLGCEIGNHTYGHKSLPKMTPNDIVYELDKMERKLDEVLGYPYTMRLMRPPYGNLSRDPNKKSDRGVVDAIGRAGYAHAVKWDVSQTDPDKAFKQTKNGSILLYHAIEKDVSCLAQLIPMLLNAGYQCVTVTELLGEN